TCSSSSICDPAAMLDRARVYWSAVHGLVTLERAGHATPPETDNLVEDLVSSLVAGWRSNRSTEL
ncbi:MAG: WHG domain-containing protein, partial [Acidimicrobiia bacterium]|nr:WHG domain-containing protein [Acidimicrobiia bacterium]